MIQSDKIKNLKEYFDVLRQRPGMYLGTNTISKLHDHLQGYQTAYWFNEIENAVDSNFFENFNEFTYRYYGVITNANWKDVILEQSFGNEQTALKTFFELFDLFIENAKATDTKKIVLAFFDKLIFEQNEMKNILGNKFSSVLNETVELLKENAMTTFKYDYDTILEHLNEKAEKIPELNTVLTELKKQHTNL